MTNKEKSSPEIHSPKDATEMRQSIISTLKRLYPMRTGYNGGHLAPIRDPNPELFFNVLHQLETEGVIEYNDTQIAMRLSEKFIDFLGASWSREDNKDSVSY